METSALMLHSAYKFDNLLSANWNARWNSLHVLPCFVHQEKVLIVLVGVLVVQKASGKSFCLPPVLLLLALHLLLSLLQQLKEVLTRHGRYLCPRPMVLATLNGSSFQLRTW